MIPRNGSPDLVGGEPLPPGSTAGWTSCAPPTAACSAVPPARAADDVAAAVAAARSAQPAWAERTAVERGDLLRDLALLLRERREEAAEIVVERRASRSSSRWARRIPPPRWASSSRARAGGLTGGRRPRACVTGPADDPAAARRGGPDHELQHAAAERRLEGVPGAPLRERRGRQALRAHARVGLALRRAGSRGGDPGWRAERRAGPGVGGRGGPRRARRRRSRQLHGLGRDRPLDQRDGRRPPREGLPGARRQERARRVRRRGPRERDPLGARVGVLERRPALCLCEQDRRARGGLRRRPGAPRRRRPCSRPSR